MRSRITARRDEATATGLDTVNAIMTDESYAEYFFFDEMSGKMSALAAGYNASFGLELTPADVSSVTYLACWDDDWARLRAYKGGTTIHSWVSKIASQAVYRFLVDERYIDGGAKTKTSDYRLTLRGIENDLLRHEIVSMVHIPEMRRALEMYYVDKVGEAEVAAAFGDADKAAFWLDRGEKTLIDVLLNTENPYAETALSLRRPGNPEIRWQPWHDRLDDDDICDTHRELRDRLSAEWGGDWDDNVICLVNSLAGSLGWDERDLDVWRERFFNRTPSVELAVKHHVRPTWIDNRYSTLRKQFNIAIRTWWRDSEI